MKNRIFVIMSLFLLLTVFSLQAHPPSSIQLDYDLQKKILHIEIKHISRNPREHRIRRIFIYVNDSEPRELYLSHQTTLASDIEDIELDAKPGDRIRVKAFCSDSGEKEATLVVTEPAEKIK